MAVADGTATIVTTPHARLVDVRTVADRVRALRARLAADRVALRVLPGLEIAQEDVARLSDNELEVVAQGPRERRWVLLEAPVSADPSPFPDAARELMARGYGVLIGHPERCRGSSALLRVRPGDDRHRASSAVRRLLVRERSRAGPKGAPAHAVVGEQQQRSGPRAAVRAWRAARSRSSARVRGYAAGS